MRSLIFTPLIPTALWLVLTLGGAALLIWYATTSRARLSRGRWLTMISLMAIALLLPLIILLNPTWLETLPPPAGKPLLTVLIDRSASMATADETDGRTRYQAALEIADAMRQLNDAYEVRIRSFDTKVSPGSLDELASRPPEGNLTDVSGALTEGLHEDRPQGQAVLLLSDGIHNAGSSAASILKTASKAKAISAPIFTKTLGGQSDVQNLAVQPLTPQQLTFVKQQASVVAEIAHQGFEGRTAEVRLLRGDEEVGRQEVLLDSTGRSEVQFQVREEQNGLYRYRIDVSPLAEEVTEADNRSTILMRVIDQPIRVLLLEGKPYWDSKFLLRNLAADPSIEMVSVVRVTDSRLLKRTLHRGAPVEVGRESVPEGDAGDAGAKTEPDEAAVVNEAAVVDKAAVVNDGPETTERSEQWQIIGDALEVLSDTESLNEYQIVVLGRDAEVFLSENTISNLRNWISRDGGSLVCSRGAPAAQISQRFGRLLPVLWTRSRESRFRVELTDTGRELRWLAGQPLSQDVDPLAGMPSLSTGTQVRKTKPMAIVLATSVAKDGSSAVPVVSYQQYGTGRVVVVEGAGMWRWAFMPPHYANQEEVYATLWHSLTRWLVSRTGLLPGQTMALQSDKVSFSTTETATATLLIREQANSGDLPRVKLSGGPLEKPTLLTPKPLGEDPGVYRVVFGRLAEGQYEVQVEGGQQPGSGENGSGEKNDDTTAFDVRSPWTERLDIDARPDLMQRIAEASGGAALEAADPQELTDQFQQHLARSRPPRVRRTSAWDRWWVLLSVVGVWGVVWGLRRNSGLI